MRPVSGVLKRTTGVMPSASAPAARSGERSRQRRSYRAAACRRVCSARIGLQALRRAVAAVGVARVDEAARRPGGSGRAAATGSRGRRRRRPPAPRPSPGPASAGSSRIASRAPGTMRAWSVSSMRRMNVPPLWRAKSQLKRAVRMLPDVGLAGGAGRIADADGHRPAILASRGGRGQACRRAAARPFWRERRLAAPSALPIRWLSRQLRRGDGFLLL